MKVRRNAGMQHLESIMTSHAHGPCDMAGVLRKFSTLNPDPKPVCVALCSRLTLGEAELMVAGAPV